MVRAMVLEGPRALRLQDFPSITPRDDEGVLTVELAGICGTDTKTYAGELDYPLPLIMGHEIVGRIARIGSIAAERWGVEVGDRVVVEGSVPCWSCSACRTGAYKRCPTRRNYGTTTPCSTPPNLWGAMAEEMYLAPGSIIHRLSDKVPLHAAAVHGVIANAVHWAVERGGARIGSTVVVRGAGAQGISSGVLAALAGAEHVVLLGRSTDAPRFEVARALGIEAIINVDEGSVPERVREACGGLADIVVDASGASSVIDEDIDLLRPEGRLVLGGLSGEGVRSSITIDKLVWKAIELCGVFTKRASSIETATRLLESRKVPFELLVTHTFSLADTEKAIQAISGHGDAFPLKAAIDPRV